jgi:hypothetical protein
MARLKTKTRRAQTPRGEMSFFSLAGRFGALQRLLYGRLLHPLITFGAGVLGLLVHGAFRLRLIRRILGGAAGATTRRIISAGLDSHCKSREGNGKDEFLHNG